MISNNLNKKKYYKVNYYLPFLVIYIIIIKNSENQLLDILNFKIRING